MQMADTQEGEGHWAPVVPWKVQRILAGAESFLSRLRQKLHLLLECMYRHFLCYTVRAIIQHRWHILVCLCACIYTCMYYMT